MKTSAIWCSVLVIVTLCAVGCQHEHSNYCAGALNDNCLNLNLDAAIDAVQHCANDQECAPDVCDLTGSMMCVQCTSSKPSACTATTPICGTDNMCRGCANNQECAPNVCDLAGSMTCVQCTTSSPAACTATTPVCGTDNTCHGCTTHAECSSNVCLLDGSCGNDTNVAYVDPAGSDNASCSKASPCKKVASALATGRPYVKFRGTTDDAVSVTGGRTVTFLADPGAKLTRSGGNGAIVNVQGDGTVLNVYDLSIADAPNNPSGIGCVVPAASGAPTLSLTRVTVTNNPGGGISIAGGSLTVSQSTISDNQGGGISISGGTFAVVGNAFFNNGGNTSLVGGISVGTATNATNRLEFNSFALNTSQDGIGPAIQCIAGTFTAKNNIMSANRTPTALANQFGGTCTHVYSIAQPGALPPGAGNAGSDPLFTDPARGDLHLQPTSPARHAADPTSDLMGLASHDIDGVSRTSPADIGAFVFKAPALRSSSTAPSPSLDQTLRRSGPWTLERPQPIQSAAQ